MAKKFEIRNSTVEFLTFVAEGEGSGYDLIYELEQLKQRSNQR